jgi:putative aldouronate transport system permease protein
MKEFKKHWQLYLFILPALIYIIIFCYVPMGGIIIAFQDYDPALGVFKSSFVGFAKLKMFFSSYYFSTIIINTLALSFFSLIVNTIFPVVFALILNEVQSPRFKKFVQTLSSAPYFISLVVLVGMFNMFLSNEGFINQILTTLGLNPINFVGDSKYFRFVYILSGLWQGLGWWAIIYIGALSNVDKSLHEAAVLDGANRLQRIWHINLPAIKPIILVLLIMSFGSLMSVGFEKAFLMQNPGNREVSEVIATYSYMVTFKTVRDFGFGSAVGLFNSVINFILLIVANTISKKVTKESLI